MSDLLGAKTDVLDQVAESLSADARRMQDIHTLAQRAVFELQTIWNGIDLVQLTRLWEQQASPQLAAASGALDSCAIRLRTQSAAQRDASRSEVTGSGRLTGLGPLLLSTLPVLNVSVAPPAHGSPGDNAAWWRSLSPLQQQQVIQEHPEWIGNRDGVSFAARDQANRSILPVDRVRLEAEKMRLETALAENWFGGAFTNDDAALDHVNDKLAALAAIDETLAKEGDRQLLLLELSAQRAQAAIACGNVDIADNVAVLVPGLSASVAGGMVDGDRNMEQLKARAELESRRVHADKSAATVMWFGYQAPQMGWDLVGENSVAADHAARAGAALLVPFLTGIGAARDADPHLTLLAHSYGSTTAGLALRQKTGVDDAVFFGSPGLGTSHLSDLNLAPGHTHYIEARQDPVGDLGYFGVDPSHLAGVDHASARESTVVDPLTGELRHFDEVTGHSSYLADDSTSQYNLSVVAAGQPDQRVQDDGEGIGDVLSWPVPGTYR